MAYYLGIDGGGTKTLSAVGDERSTLGSARAGPGNLLRVGAERVRDAFSNSIAAACASAGIRMDQVSEVCLGAAGAARPEVSRALNQLLAELLPEAHVQICGDMEIALAAAVGDDPGLVVIAGTGSIAFGRNAKGETARAGGAGPENSDEGSGHWIGQRAMAALKKADPDDCYRRLSMAVRNALEDINKENIEEAFKSGTPVPELGGSCSPAALFPAVLAESNAGNPLVEGILEEAGAELAGLAASVCGELFNDQDCEDSAKSSLPPERSAIAVALAGGVFRHSELVRQAFTRQLAKLCPQAEVRSGIIEPVEGALWMARQAGCRP